MTYSFPEIHRAAAQKPNEIDRILAVGNIDSAHLYITLPDDFDWQGPAPSPHTPPKAIIPASPSSILGLGDLVAVIIKPIVRIIDRILGTNLANCPACTRRQAWLNLLSLPRWITRLWSGWRKTASQASNRVIKTQPCRSCEVAETAKLSHP